MIYLYDFLFVALFLGIKDVAMWLLDSQPDIYVIVRKYYMWFEFSFVCLAIYFIPTHNIHEAEIAFFMSLCTKGLHDIIKKKTNRLTRYEQSFLNKKHKL